MFNNLFVPNISFAVAFFAGLASFFSPCVFPLIPSYLSYITGISTGELGIKKGIFFKTRVFVNSLFFVTGFTAVFVILGLFSGQLGSIVKNIWFMRISGITVIFMGLFIMGVFFKIKFLYFLYSEKQIEFNPVRRSRALNYLSSFLIGVVFAATWTPCVGPVLASILFIGATLHNTIKGGELLFIYSSGLALPFLASSFSLGLFLGISRKIKPYIKNIQIISGILLVVMGILIFFNYLTIISTWAGNV
jgi:cytochrome c-type biogenesis protein